MAQASLQAERPLARTDWILFAGILLFLFLAGIDLLPAWYFAFAYTLGAAVCAYYYGFRSGRYESIARPSPQRGPARGGPSEPPAPPKR